MKGRRYHTTKTERKQDYSKLFTDTEKAKLLYLESHEFRQFVYDFDNRYPNTPLEDVYKVYSEGSLELSLF